RLLLIFFFQAEDGIRDFHVTGVQTCALPISPPRLRLGERALADPGRLRQRTERHAARLAEIANAGAHDGGLAADTPRARPRPPRSEERRVGKEWRAPRSPAAENKDGERGCGQ